jgi:hypothetical protein
VPIRGWRTTWPLTELDHIDEHLAFGLCDLGLGDPELGYVSLHELAAARGALGLPLERDLYFAPTRTIAAYAELAREHRRIVTGGVFGRLAAEAPDFKHRTAFHAGG